MLSEQTNTDTSAEEISSNVPQPSDPVQINNDDGKPSDAKTGDDKLADFGAAFHEGLFISDEKPSGSAAIASSSAECDAPGPANDQPGSARLSDQGTVPQEYFCVKEIDTIFEKRKIVLQSVNGPCPLIAIVNSLLLQGKIVLGNPPYITAPDLCSVLGNYLLDHAQQRSNQNKQDEAHTEQYIIDSLDRFVQIQTGIDVNVKFDSVEGFEYTPELSLFDIAGVRVFHGWVIDPQDTVLAQLVGDLTYNQLVEKAMDMSCSTDTQEVSESLLLKDHLASSQITVHGICELNGTLKDNEVAVLFRNNHFTTITKNNDMLYMLVSDVGWNEQPYVVWETLDSTCNSTSFVDGHYNPSKEINHQQDTNKISDEDYALSLELQISEEEKQEQERLWEEAKRQNDAENAERFRDETTPPGGPPQPTGRNNKERRRSEGKSNSCSIM